MYARKPLNYQKKEKMDEGSGRPPLSVDCWKSESVESPMNRVITALLICNSVVISVSITQFYRFMCVVNVI